MDEAAILNPKKEITIGSGTVIVKELRWHETLDFLKTLAAKAGKFVTVHGDGRVTGNFTVEQLVEIVTGSEELTKKLILGSTGKDEAFYNELGTGEALELLDAALGMTLNEAVLKKAGALGRHFRAAFPGAKTTVAASAQSTTTSSGKDTAAPS